MTRINQHWQLLSRLIYLAIGIITIQVGYAVATAQSRHVLAVEGLPDATRLVVYVGAEDHLYGVLDPSTLDVVAQEARLQQIALLEAAPPEARPNLSLAQEMAAREVSVIVVNSWAEFGEILDVRTPDAVIISRERVDEIDELYQQWVTWAYKNGVVLAFLGVPVAPIQELVNATTLLPGLDEPTLPNHTPCIVISSLALAPDNTLMFLEASDWRAVLAEGSDLSASDTVDNGGYTSQSISAGFCDVDSEGTIALMFINIYHTIDGFQQARVEYTRIWSNDNE